jgi:hypothetical protein
LASFFQCFLYFFPILSFLFYVSSYILFSVDLCCFIT